MTQFVISGYASEKQTPSLCNFLQTLDLRSISSRSMLCRLIDRAVSLSEQDKKRYDAAFLGVLRPQQANSKRRRFTLVVVDVEQPTTFANLKNFGYDQERHSSFIHLLEIAAGLLMLESMAITSGMKGSIGAPVPVSPPLPSPSSDMPKLPDARQQAEPQKPTQKSRNEIISSSADYGEMDQIPAEDIAELMG